jgi:hypothetical protein
MNASYEQLLAPRLLDSRLKLHLILQFLIHPQLVTTAAALSERLRENPWAIADALAELAECQMLTCNTQQGKLVYRLSADLLHRSRLERLFEDFNDPLKRDQIHAHVHEANRERQYHILLAGDERVVGQYTALVA